MSFRIVRLRGASAAARQRHLERLQAWMEGRGWRLVDGPDAEESVAFERNPQAPPLGWLDASRWFCNPDWFYPWRWWQRPRFTVRGLLLGVVCLMVGAVFVGVLSYSHSRPIPMESAKQKERWLYVQVNMLNVRASPVSDAQIVGVLFENQKVLVEQLDDEGWARLSQPERGFVGSRFLKPYPTR